MKNIQNVSVLVILLLVIFSACRKNFDIDEINKFSDSIAIDGSVAAPLINAHLSLNDFNIEQGDDQMWFEIDENNLIHVRMKFDLGTTTFSTISPILPVEQGFSLDGNSIRISTDKKDLNLGDIGFDIEGEYYIADPKIDIIMNRPKVGTVSITQVSKNKDRIQWSYEEIKQNH